LEEERVCEPPSSPSKSHASIAQYQIWVRRRLQEVSDKTRRRPTVLFADLFLSPSLSLVLYVHVRLTFEMAVVTLREFQTLVVPC
jgi:hypothetical protein